MREEVWLLLCSFDERYAPLIIVQLIILLAVVVTLPALERGSASFIIAVVDLALLIPTVAAFLYIRYRCQQFT